MKASETPETTAMPTRDELLKLCSLDPKGMFPPQIAALQEGIKSLLSVKDAAPAPIHESITSLLIRWQREIEYGAFDTPSSVAQSIIDRFVKYAPAPVLTEEHVKALLKEHVEIYAGVIASESYAPLTAALNDRLTKQAPQPEEPSDADIEAEYDARIIASRGAYEP